MARTVNYTRRAEKIKDQIDWLVKEMSAEKTVIVPKEKLRLSDIDFSDIDVRTLMQIQAKISKVILDKSKQKGQIKSIHKNLTEKKPHKSYNNDLWDFLYTIISFPYLSFSQG